MESAQLSFQGAPFFWHKGPLQPLVDNSIKLIQEGEELEKMLQEATGPWNASLQNVLKLKNEFHE